MSNGIPSIGVARSRRASGKAVLVLAHTGRLFDLDRLLARRQGSIGKVDSLQWLIERDDFCVDVLGSVVAEGDGAELTDSSLERLCSPLPLPGKVLALGRSFPAHAAEGGNPTVDEPLLFTKLPENLVAPSDGVALPASKEDRFDNEIELAAVFGRDVSGDSNDAVMDAVAGYMILNDITWRNRQVVLKSEGHPWFLAKNLPGAAPFGPWLVPSDSLGDINSLAMTCFVNGEQKLDATTAGLMCPVPQLLSWVSRQVPIYSGDVVSLGTPKGLSSVRPGDEVVGSVAGLGEQRFIVRERKL